MTCRINLILFINFYIFIKLIIALPNKNNTISDINIKNCPGEWPVSFIQDIIKQYAYDHGNVFEQLTFQCCYSDKDCDLDNVCQSMFSIKFLNIVPEQLIEIGKKNQESYYEKKKININMLATGVCISKVRLNEIKKEIEQNRLKRKGEKCQGTLECEGALMCNWGKCGHRIYKENGEYCNNFLECRSSYCNNSKCESTS
jgi:hypothetical protein